MNSKEIVQRALRHQSGPIPVDFGSTLVTGMHVTAVAALRDHHGLEKRPVRVCEPYQMLGLIEPDLQQALGVDVVGVFPPKTLFGFALGDWKSWTAPWGQDLLVPGDFNVTEKDGAVYIYPEGDMSVPASGHMPASGYFFDTIIRQEPIDEAALNPQDNLEEFDLLSQADLDLYQASVQAQRDGGKAVAVTMPGTGFGDIALVPAPFAKHPKGIRDITEWYVSTAIRQDYIHAIFEKQLEYALANLERLYQTIGNQIDVAFLCGTDFGTQISTFCSRETYTSLWHPYYKAINDWIHTHTHWKTFKHSCGAVFSFMDLFIESGFDIINPVQCSAEGMDPKALKREFGDQLVFWGGGVDTQKTLPFGSPEEVHAQVLERCEIFSENGGFVFDAIHNVQANTPIENIVAMFKAVQEFNGSKKTTDPDILSRAADANKRKPQAQP